MKAKSYKLKYAPTPEQLISLGFREGGTWIKKDAKYFKTKFLRYLVCPYDFEFTVNICFSEDTSIWNDFENVEVIDEDFGQPYTAFYGENYKTEIAGFPVLEYCIKKYNEFMGSFDFLEEVTE